MFCLNLTKHELKKVLDQMEFNINNDPHQMELEIFDKMVALMEEQTKSLLEQRGLDENVKENLEAIPDALQKMKNARAQY